jgi:DNA-binding winged helix-turn-helix (wHTH) protein
MPPSGLATANVLPLPDPVPSAGPDPGTLLAVVPIPGTGSSLAIVGYEIPAGLARDGGTTSPRPAGGLIVDHAQRRVWLGTNEIHLTYQEFELLAFLSANPARVFSRAELLSRVWERCGQTDTRTVDVHVSRLRRKLGPAYGQCLITEYRVGYRFDPPGSDDGVHEGPAQRPGGTGVAVSPAPVRLTEDAAAPALRGRRALRSRRTRRDAVLDQVVDVQRAKHFGGLALAGAQRVGDQRGHPVHISACPARVPLDCLRRGNRAQQLPQETYVQVMHRAADGKVMKLSGGKGLQVAAARHTGHPTRSA